MAVSLAVSALEEHTIEIVLVQVIKHCIRLVPRSGKVERESTSGEVRRYFGVEVCSAANGSDMGTCKSWRSGERLVLVLVWCLEGIIKLHTYRMQEIWP